MMMMMMITQIASPRSPSHIMPVMKLRKLSPHCSPQVTLPSCDDDDEDVVDDGDDDDVDDDDDDDVDDDTALQRSLCHPVKKKNTW